MEEEADLQQKLRQKDDMEVVIDTIKLVHKSSSLEEIYGVILDSVIELENIDMATIYLVDEGKREAVLQAHRNIPEDYIRRAGRIPYRKGVTWKIINDGRMLNVEDIQKDLAIGPAGRELGFHSALGIPIPLKEKATGVIWFLSYKKRKFNEKEVNLLSFLCDQIAIAIAKAEAFKKIKQWKDTLQESEQMYHSLVEYTYELVCEVNSEGKVLYVNSKLRDLLGYEPKELVGRSIFENIHPDDHPAVIAEFARTAKTFSSGQVVYRYRHKNGRWHWLESTGGPFKTAVGEFRGVIASRDITEHKRMREEFLKAHRRGSVVGKESKSIPVNLMVVSSSTLLRNGIRKVLEPEEGIQIVAEASTHLEVISLIEEANPDVLFIDTSLPNLDIGERLEAIMEVRPEAKVILLLHTLDEEMIINAISLGFSGVLTDVSDTTQLNKAIRAVNEGEIWAERKIITKAFKRLLPPRGKKLKLLKSILTKREEEIINLVTQGYSNKQISRELFISQSTLKTHLTNAFKKLSVTNRYQLLYGSIHNGGIPKKC